ncbi:MAG: protoporphyrinogen oxidase [Microbacteriaceae bacterium]|nr:protoporphyrinogen oxidase [Microbacteriaceae bacterium]
MHDSGKHTAVVVGGGVGGLVLARQLALGGMRVTLVEASDRLGGKVARHTVAGIDLDAGAESFATRNGTVAALAAELGLASKVVKPNPDGAWLQPMVGPAIPLPKTGLLGIPATPLAADVVAAIGFPAALRAQFDLLMLGFSGSKERNLGRLVRRRMGSAVVDKLVAPIVTGIHSRGPDELDVDTVAPGLRTAMLSTGSLAHAVAKLRAAAPAGSAVSGIEGGVYGLVERLARDLAGLEVTVRLGATVTAADAGGVSLADGERIAADHVVLATPLVPVSAPSITLATLVVEAAGLDAAPRGTGLLVAAGAQGILAKALTHATAKWRWLADAAPTGVHVLRLSYSWSEADGEAELRAQAMTDASSLLGVQLQEVGVRGFSRVDWRGVPAAEALPTGVTGVGEAYSGTGLAAVISGAQQEAGRLLKEVAT